MYIFGVVDVLELVIFGGRSCVYVIVYGLFNFRDLNV